MCGVPEQNNIAFDSWNKIMVLKIFIHYLATTGYNYKHKTLY